MNPDTEVEMQNQYTNRMIKNLKKLRESAGLTQEKLGVKLGVSRQTISTIETRNCSLTWSLYLAMVCVFQQYDDSKALLEKLKLFDSGFIKENL